MAGTRKSLDTLTRVGGFDLTYGPKEQHSLDLEAFGLWIELL